MKEHFFNIVFISLSPTIQIRLRKEFPYKSIVSLSKGNPSKYGKYFAHNKHISSSLLVKLHGQFTKGRNESSLVCQRAKSYSTKVGPTRGALNTKSKLRLWCRCHYCYQAKLSYYHLMDRGGQETPLWFQSNERKTQCVIERNSMCYSLICPPP